MAFKRIIFFACLLSSCTCSRMTSELHEVMDAKIFARVVSMMTAQEHPFGSEAQRALAGQLRAEIENLPGGPFKVIEQAFEAEVPRAEAIDAKVSPMLWTERRKGINLLIEVISTRGKKCSVLFGSHYDTKKIAGGAYLGANDSASSTAALIASLGKMKAYFAGILSCGVEVVLFDGEEAVLPNWTDGETLHPAKIVDNTYGSRHFVTTLGPRKEILKGFILLDMIGSPDVKLSFDSRSTPELISKARELAREMEDPLLFGSDPVPIEDDHIPFLAAGIPAVNLIDFHHVGHWHKTSDTAETLSEESVARVMRLALKLGAYIAEEKRSR